MESRLPCVYLCLPSVVATLKSSSIQLRVWPGSKPHTLTNW